eukprot:jgi/Botrbrau1/23062/Bobra.0243s0004.1
MNREENKSQSRWTEIQRLISHGVAVFERRFEHPGRPGGRSAMSTSAQESVAPAPVVRAGGAAAAAAAHPATVAPLAAAGADSALFAVPPAGGTAGPRPAQRAVSRRSEITCGLMMIMANY